MHGQQTATVRMEWGAPGAAAICVGAAFAVVVDVLSFTTALSVAIDGGAEVFPYRWRDSSATDFARLHRATLAADRSRSGQSPISLSPASIRSADGLQRIVLPSPNGSALSAGLAASGVLVIGACLRNRTAVAQWLVSTPPSSQGIQSSVIAVVAAGERWPDDSLRLATEDLWGAGAVICALVSLGVTGLSPEARSAAAAFEAVQADLCAGLMNCSSGRELAAKGLSQDVLIAAEIDSSTSVPILVDGRFVGATWASGSRLSD